MVCPDCRGRNFESGKYTMAQVFYDQPIVLYNVPAKRCRQCGFDVISAETSRRIEKALLAEKEEFVRVATVNLDADSVSMDWRVPRDQAVFASNNYVSDLVTSGTAGIS
jgi:hypothetical protein